MILATANHVHIGYKNPYLRCEGCDQRVTYWHDANRCGCGEEPYNYPCNHTAGVYSKCPTWTIIDGCSCSPTCKR